MSMELISRIKSSDLTSWFKKTITWTLSEKASHDLTLNNSSRIISFSWIDIPKVICISGDGVFKVSISTATQDLDMVVDSGLFLLTPTLAFANSITQLTVTEENSLDVNVEVRIYGEESES